jgi:Putative transposase of IS4/5 family (DUF4096)
VDGAFCKSSGILRQGPWHDTRSVLNEVFWVLGTGAQWRELPEKYPPFQTCHRRFQQWVRSGKLVMALKLLARHLHERGKLNLDEAFVDATFASAKKGVLLSAPQLRQGHGVFAGTNHVVERITGQRPTSLPDFLQAHISVLKG